MFPRIYSNIHPFRLGTLYAIETTTGTAPKEHTLRVFFLMMALPECEEKNESEGTFMHLCTYLL